MQEEDDSSSSSSDSPPTATLISQTSSNCSKTESSEPFEKEEKTQKSENDNSAKFESYTSVARLKRARRLASLLPFYWGSLLTEEQLPFVLGTQDSCILIDGPLKYSKSGIEIALYWLCVKKRSGVEKLAVKCAANELLINSSKLLKYISHKKLKPVHRKITWKENELLPNHTLPDPVLSSLFEMGQIARKNIVFNNQSIPILSITASGLTEDEMQIVLQDIRKMIDFGCSNVLRLWGTSVNKGDVQVLLEDVTLGPITSYLSKIDKASLVDISRQIGSAVHYFEMSGFVHKKLSTDVCLLTHNQQVKVAVFALSTGVFPKKIYLEETDRCRWLPWECLAPEPEEYTGQAMVWTFGTILWSIYHEGILPYEDEPSRLIKNKKYRQTATLPIYPNILPDVIEKAITKCWSERKDRPSMTEIQVILNKK